MTISTPDISIMQTETLEKLILEALNNIKALDIITLDVRTLTDITDSMIICSGTSNTHTRSIAKSIIRDLKDHEQRPLAIEGEGDGEWVLVDYGDVLVHIMLPRTREFYALEKLWCQTARKKEQQLSQTSV